jgi:lactoylglutathione lyase
MPNATIVFDHVHLISKDAIAAANWYVEKFGASVAKNMMVKGAPQVYVNIGDGSMIIIRGERPGESIAGKTGLEWGVDHFGVRINKDFDGFCATLKAKGVEFSLEPTDFNPDTRIAFVKAPDGVSVELLNRKDMD